MYFKPVYQQLFMVIEVVMGMGLIIILSQPTFGQQIGEKIHGDFNGDGYDDLAIGVPSEDRGAIANAGAVQVLYGSSTAGLQATGRGAPNDQLWYQDVANVNGTSEANDLFGSALCMGDFNGDGYADLAVGVPGEGNGGPINAGAVHVLYGSANGLQASGVSGPDDQIWYNESPNDPLNDEVPDLFGWSLGAGDFNNDGFDDLAVGIPNDTANGVISAGSVKILYGSDIGLQNTGVGGPDDQLWHQDSPGVMDNAEPTDHFGWSISVGDFNGDDYDDLAVGVYWEDVWSNPTIMDAGAVNVLYGSDIGLQATGAGWPNDQFWHQNRPSVRDTAEAFDLFGWSLSSGDFNGDGYDDLAVGVPFEDIGNPVIVNAGVVNVLYGSDTGLQASGVGGSDDQFWHQNSNSVLGTAEASDRFGYSMSVGDFNGDGYDDLAAGVPYEDTGNPIISDAGVVNVVYGSDAGLQASGVGGSNDQVWYQNSSSVQGTAETNDYFGWSLGVGDFDGDGYDDLVVGVPYEGIGGNPLIDDAGVMQVFYGLDTGLQATGVDSPNDQLWYQGNSGLQGSAEAFDSFGSALGVSRGQRQ